MTENEITDLPEPDSPSKQTISPALTSKLMCSAANGRSAPVGSEMLTSRKVRTALIASLRAY